IETIKEFCRRHFGEYIDVKDTAELLAFIQGTGIGGQRNTTGMLKKLVRLFPNRDIHLYSAYGAPFKETTEYALRQLNKFHKGLTLEKRLELLKKRQERFKLFNRAASKSGTTPETMVGFQNQVKAAIRLYSMFVYGKVKGKKFAERMIGRLYDGKNLLTGGESVENLNKEERMILAIVLDRVILATGEYRETGREEVDGRARVGGSMFDCFAKAMARRLKDEFNELGISGISKVTLYDSFGGRTQVLGPDAFINIAMALYDGKTDSIKRIIEEVRPIAVLNNNMGDRNLFGKKLAALAMSMGVEFMYIGLPTSIESNVVDAFQQLIGESIDVGALVGHPTGIKPVVCPTTVLTRKSQFKKDNGKRLYVLITDELADEATKKAEEEIIKREKAKGNHVVRIRIKDHSPMEIAKLSYIMLNFVEWYSNFTTAEILANLKKYPGIIEHMCKNYGLKEEEIKNISFDDPKIVRIIAALYSKKPLEKREPRYYQALRKIVLNLNVWFQPGVEWGKTAAKKIAEKLFVKKFRTIIDPVTGKELKVPVRDEELRQKFYAEQRGKLKGNKGAYLVDDTVYQTVGGRYKGVKINTEAMPGISINKRYKLQDVLKQIKVIAKLKERQDKLFDTVDENGNYQLKKRREKHDKLEARIAKEAAVLEEIASQVACNEKTAQQLARVAYDTHQRGQSVAFSLYAGRQRFEDLGFENISRMLDMFDTFQYAPDKQHTDADGDVAGTKTAFQILTHVREPHGERTVTDGMVAPYWSDLSDQDLIYVNHTAYGEVYREREIDHIGLRLEGERLLDIAKIYVLFAQANRIYLRLNRQDEIIRALKSGNPDLRLETVRKIMSLDPKLREKVLEHFASLPISGKAIFNVAKVLRVPVPACNIDNGELSALFQIRPLMEAALENNALIIFEVGPGALKTYAEGKPHLPEYCARVARQLYKETGKMVNYAVHLDHNQIDKKKFPKDSRKALQEAIDRARLALRVGFTSFATDTSNLTNEDVNRDDFDSEEEYLHARLQHVIETGAEILRVI
ncbi:class II fructose-bisphosphate aldolase, partial [Candidatus Pacearchaeota archaeon]|nr:class II fructose-bisphosphate aldolase [Candidatus Pacearchaeota archaeon]